MAATRVNHDLEYLSGVMRQFVLNNSNASSTASSPHRPPPPAAPSSSRSVREELARSIGELSAMSQGAEGRGQFMMSKGTEQVPVADGTTAYFSAPASPLPNQSALGNERSLIILFDDRIRKLEREVAELKHVVTIRPIEELDRKASGGRRGGSTFPAQQRKEQPPAAAAAIRNSTARAVRASRDSSLSSRITTRTSIKPAIPLEARGLSRCSTRKSQIGNLSKRGSSRPNTAPLGTEGGSRGERNTTTTSTAARTSSAAALGSTEKIRAQPSSARRAASISSSFSPAMGGIYAGGGNKSLNIHIPAAAFSSASRRPQSAGLPITKGRRTSSVTTTTTTSGTTPIETSQMKKWELTASKKAFGDSSGSKTTVAGSSSLEGSRGERDVYSEMKKILEMEYDELNQRYLQLVREGGGGKGKGGGEKEALTHIIEQMQRKGNQLHIVSQLIPS